MAVPAAARPALWPEGGRLPPSRIIPGLPGSQNGSEGRKKGSPAPERFSPAELSPRGRRTEERGRRPLGSAARQSLGREGIWAGGDLAGRDRPWSRTSVWFFICGKDGRTRRDPLSCISYECLQGAGGICQ